MWKLEDFRLCESRIRDTCRLRRENFQSKSLAESMADSGLRAALMETIGGLMATDQVVLDPAKIRFLCRGD